MKDSSRTIESVRRVLLHGSSDASFDHAVRFAAKLTEGFGAELHVVYTVEEPLSSGWTAELPTARLPELHQAMDQDARERLARVLPEDSQALITVAIRTGGDSADELVRYTAEHAIDLAIVQDSDEAGRALVDRGRCSVLLLR
jgi:nucleotide-binding universal stress UspA family protein